MAKISYLPELDKEVKRIQSIRKPNQNTYKYSEKLSKKAKKALDDIEKNNNNSWALFMYERNLSSNAMNKVAIQYRGNKITYGEMWSKVFEYCKALKVNGVKKGDQVPVCISNIPEYLYLLLACSLVGATIHLVGNWFNKDSLKNILDKTNSSLIFVSDDVYPSVADAIEESNIEKTILLSLEDSLMKGRDWKPFNPYQEIDGPEHNFSSHYTEYKTRTSKIMISQNEFLNSGLNYSGEVLENVSLDDVATISYTSGTTEKGCPKGVKHSNRVYIAGSRFKKSDVSGMPEMKDLIAQYEVPVYSHTNIGNVADTFFCNCTYSSEPFVETKFILKSLLINKPNYCQSTIGRWLYLGKELGKEENKNITFPYLIMADVVGEGCTPGEEKFLNKTARKHKFGVKKLPFPLSPVTFSMGGGTCEAGGVFTTLFHELQSKRLILYGKNYSLGMIPFNLIEYEVINQNGDYCKINEPGFLAVKSPTEFLGYTDPTLDETAYIVDKYGKKWINMGTLSYKSEPRFRSVKMKGRVDDYVYLKDGSFFPTYKIEESISKDTKNIMSVAVIKMDDGTYVCHLEKQPDSKKNIIEILKSCALRLERDLPSEIFERLYFRVRSFEEGFPVAKSGKRDFKYLKTENNIDKLIYVEDVFVQSSLKEKESILTLKK